MVNALKHWLTKWTVWEFLPWWIANIPIGAMYAWFALRSRHLFFFSNVNPAIPLGGAMGESKIDILNLLPDSLKPKTIFTPGAESFEKVLQRMSDAGIGFPVVAKPDVGERGFLVQKFTGPESLQGHLERYAVPFIIQEFLTMPVEMTVLYHRFPGSERFGITSVCVKEFLSVTGDGSSSVRELMALHSRAAFQIPRFEQENPGILENVPANGENLLLEPIGNHVRGTKFLNGNHLINPVLEAAFQPICSNIEGVLYGRFDLKCASVEALYGGEFKTMELNGVLGEPAHVYDPAFGMWRAYRDFYRHWKLLFELSRAQKRIGVLPTSHRAAWQFVRQYFQYKKQLESR